jgi:hypothetical protein
MKAAIWIVLTTGPVLWATAAGATGRIAIQTALNVETVSFEAAAEAQMVARWQPRSETSAEKRRRLSSDQDVDLDLDDAPLDSHRTLMPGQKQNPYVTGAPGGYDAKRLNRLWGRFSGAKTNAKAEKAPKSKNQDVQVRPGRWAR